jgi:VWA domain-containing protein
MTEPVNGGTGTGLDFTIEIDATYDLAVDADRVEALITVQAGPGRATAPAARTAEVLIMDRSLSMMGQNKIHEARRAACAAIDALPTGALLGIIAGNELAARVFPPAGGLAAIDAGTQRAAKHTVMSLMPEGGTKIGRWLTAANELFAAESAAGGIRHAVLYTDGKNEHETRPELDAALGACADRFVCDVRGLGDDWNYTELRRIADALHGDATAVLRIADLADDFIGLMRRVRRLVVPRTYLRLSLNDRFRIAAIGQTYPVQADLTRHQRPADATAPDVFVPLGPWEEQATRRYQVSLRFDPAAIPAGERLRAARVDLLVELPDGTREPCANAPITVFRHATPGFETVMPESLTRAENERELGLAMRACADAWLHKRAAEADDELNLAFRLARKFGDVRLPLLESVSVIAPDGGARLRTDVTVGEMQKFGLDSAKTSMRVPRARPASQEGADGAADGADKPENESAGAATPARVCDACGEPNEEDAAYCVECGEPLHGGAAP